MIPSNGTTERISGLDTGSVNHEFSIISRRKSCPTLRIFSLRSFRLFVCPYARKFNVGFDLQKLDLFAHPSLRRMQATGSVFEVLTHHRADRHRARCKFSRETINQSNSYIDIIYQYFPLCTSVLRIKTLDELGKFTPVHKGALMHFCQRGTDCLSLSGSRTCHEIPRGEGMYGLQKYNYVLDKEH